ncbi:MAG: MoxR family ATPase [Deltaproteobacteria bacterium]|nr:MoxR family ATPase [Deltaproteobacteria bacterium]
MLQCLDRSMHKKITALMTNVAEVIHGKDEIIRLATVCLLARGHLLIEDVPGVGKTTLASALASSLRCSFQRIQLTSDLLPSDLLGTMIYDSASQNFRFKPGPIFHHIVLADEINRTNPRTQSALLEAMNEAQVTLDSRTYPLPHPFMVLATQNPAEFAGTFPLPESQLDRFLMRISIGYPAREAERRVITEMLSPAPLRPVMCADEVLELQALANQVRVEASLVDYVLDIIEATRNSSAISLGGSPRAAKSLYRAAQAFALVEGYEYGLPRHIKELVVPVLAHRLLLNEMESGPAATHRAEEVLLALLAEVKVPL